MELVDEGAQKTRICYLGAAHPEEVEPVEVDVPEYENRSGLPKVGPGEEGGEDHVEVINLRPQGGHVGPAKLEGQDAQSGDEVVLLEESVHRQVDDVSILLTRLEAVDDNDDERMNDEVVDGDRRTRTGGKKRPLKNFGAEVDGEGATWMRHAGVGIPAV